MNRRRVLFSLLAGMLTLPARRAEAADVLHVDEQPIDSSLEVSYAQAQGFNTEAHIDMQIQLLSNGAAGLAAVVGGAVDIGNTNILSLLIARERGLPLVMLVPAALYNPKEPSSYIMVPNDSILKTGGDFNGKTIAVDGLKNITQYGIMAWVDKNGGNSQSLKFVEMPFPDMAVALSSHRVDAAVVVEPFASSAFGARKLTSAYDGIAPSFIIGGWIATNSWVAANQVLAQNFAKMIYRTANWANANRAASAQTLLQTARLSASTLKALPRATFAEHYDPVLIQPVINVALKYGAITKSVRPEEVEVVPISGGTLQSSVAL